MLDLPPERPPFFFRLMHWPARLALRLLRWRVQPMEPPQARCVAIGAPHTDNWDGVLFILMLFVLQQRLYWMGKHSLFRWPVGPFLRSMGGVPIDRRARHSAVEQMIAEFARREQFVLLIAPEGTRSPAPYWKTGFYHIAQGAGVPVVMGFIDYRTRTIGFGPSLTPSGDIEADFATLRAFYAEIRGLHPEKVGPVAARPQQAEAETSHERPQG